MVEALIESIGSEDLYAFSPNPHPVTHCDDDNYIPQFDVLSSVSSIDEGNGKYITIYGTYTGEANVSKKSKG